MLLRAKIRMGETDLAAFEGRLFEDSGLQRTHSSPTLPQDNSHASSTKESSRSSSGSSRRTKRSDSQRHSYKQAAKQWEEPATSGYLSPFRSSARTPAGFFNGCSRQVVMITKLQLGFPSPTWALVKACLFWPVTASSNLQVGWWEGAPAWHCLIPVSLCFFATDLLGLSVYFACWLLV